MPDVPREQASIIKLVVKRRDLTEKQRGMLWPSVISKLELARADVQSMIKVYDSGPK